MIVDDESLAKKIYNEQLKHSWPGLVMEGDEICDLLGLPVISKNEISRGEIHSARKSY